MNRSLLMTITLVLWEITQVLAQDAREGLVFYCHTCKHPKENVVCVGEAISSRAISHGGIGDSAIGSGGNNCYFSALSQIGQKIRRVCPIRMCI